MDTVLIVGLAAFGVLTALTLFLVVLLNRRVRRVSGIVAIVLTVVSTLAALWGIGGILCATAPVPDDVALWQYFTLGVCPQSQRCHDPLELLSLPTP